MKELDFDELDKAVNSFMKSVPSSSPTKTDDDVNTVTLPDDTTSDTSATQSTPAASDDTPSDTVKTEENTDQSDTSDVKSEDTVPLEGRSTTTDTQPEPEESAPGDASGTSSQSDTSSAPAVVPHRKGRFMDVKHASSTMRRPTSSSSAASSNLRASREGTTLTPPTRPESDIDQPRESITDTTTPEEPASLESPEVEEPKEDMVDKPNDTVQDTTETKKPESSSSPADYSAFLTDAKVKKRPLGQPQPPAPTAEKVELPGTDDTYSSKDDKDTDNAAATTDTPVAPEFDKHLMAIESGDTAPEPPKPEKPTGQEPKGGTSPESDTQKSTSTPVLNGPTSIQQQYREEPSSGDQTSGAIYDTDSYHQPLKHPEKKKTGWLWVILIVVVILLGIGGGAFIYLNGM